MTERKPIDYSKIDLSKIDWSTGWEEIPDDDLGPATNGGTAPQAPLVYIDMSRWDAEPTPEQEWIVYNRIPRRECVLFSGEGGAGKSIGQLHLSIAAALGLDWLGAIPERGPAIFIDAEDDEKVLHRRTKAIGAHYEVSVTDMIEGGLRLASWRGCDPALAVVARNGKIQPTLLYQQLLEAAGDIKPVLIGIAASANVVHRLVIRRCTPQVHRPCTGCTGCTVPLTMPPIP